MRCFQCEIDSIDNLIESIDIIYKYSYNGENERNAAHGYSSTGSLCLYREVPQFFTCCAEAVSVAADCHAHICNLEKELHTQLLKRTTKTLSVTPAGQTLYNYAAEILDLRHKAILELSNGQETMLHIGVSSVPSLYLLPELLAAYHEKAPEIRFRTSCSDSLDVINKVADSTCDIGLVGTKTAEANCEFLPVTSDELVIAAPNTPHFCAYQSQPEPLTALLREPFLLREDNSGTKQETLYFLQNHGLSLDELNVIAVMDDAAALKRCITLGMGISILSRATVQTDAQQGRLLLFPLGQSAFLRRLYIVYPSIRRMSEQAIHFLDFIKRYYRIR